MNSSADILSEFRLDYKYAAFLFEIFRTPVLQIVFE